jgi:ribonuclease HII
VVAAVACASTAEICRINILQATFLAMCRAFTRLAVRPDHVLVDGNQEPAGLGCSAQAIVGGDAKCLSIAAASILAKVMRDRAMARLGLRYPDYGWERNAGYGTAEHRRAIVASGATRHHRITFRTFSNPLVEQDS